MVHHEGSIRFSAQNWHILSENLKPGKTQVGGFLTTLPSVLATVTTQNYRPSQRSDWVLDGQNEYIVDRLIAFNTILFLNITNAF